MRRSRQSKPTLLGEAFAMKESRGWEDIADGIRIREKIIEQRRRLLLRIGLGAVALVLVIVVVLVVL